MNNAGLSHIQRQYTRVWGSVLQTQLSLEHVAPYALASGGVVVIPGQLINHGAPRLAEVILAPQGRVQSPE